MKLNKPLIKFTVLCLIVLFIFLLNDKKDGSDVVLIGGAYMLTGPTSLVGEHQINATQLAVEEINRTGGINGKKFDVIAEDTQFNAKTALSAYHALKNRGVEFIVVGGSPVVASIHPEVIKNEEFMIVTDATLPSYFDNKTNTCRLALTAKDFGPGLSQILRKRGHTKVVTLYPDNEAGRGFYTEFEKDFTNNGGEIVASEFYIATGASDYRTSLLKIKSKQSNVDALVYQNITNTGEIMLKQMKEMGIEIPIVTDYYTINNPTIKDLMMFNNAEFVDYDYTKKDMPSDNTNARSFKELYRSRFGTDPSYFAASTYDAIILIAEGIKNVGHDPIKVGDYISNLKDYHGVTGLLSFNNDCEVKREMKFSKITNGLIVR